MLMTGQLPPLCMMISSFQDLGWKNCLPWDSDGKEKAGCVTASIDVKWKPHMSFLLTVYWLKQVMAKPEVSRVEKYNLLTTRESFNNNTTHQIRVEDVMWLRWLNWSHITTDNLKSSTNPLGGPCPAWLHCRSSDLILFPLQSWHQFSWIFRLCSIAIFTDAMYRNMSLCQETPITSLMWDGRITFMKVLLGSVRSGALANLLSNQVRKTIPILLVNKSTQTTDTKSHGQKHVKLGFETRILTTEFWEIELRRQWLEFGHSTSNKEFCPPFIARRQNDHIPPQTF